MNKPIKVGIFTQAIMMAAIVMVVMALGACNKTQQDSQTSLQGSGNLAILTINSTNEFSFPPIIDLFQYNDNNPFREEYRIWGWSREGKVAHSHIMQHGGVTGKYVEIFNLVDNSRIYSSYVEVWDTDEAYDFDDQGNALDPDGNIIDFDAIYKEFYITCIENGIKFVQSEYRQLPIVHNNRTFNIIEDIIRKDDGGLDLVDRYRIIAEAQGQAKIVQAAEVSSTYDIFSLGYFISPFENRALLVMGEYIMGGYKTEFFVGFDLDSGFSEMNNIAIGSPVETMQIIDLDNGMVYDPYIYDYLDKIEVIGWSGNGLIAYIYADDAAGYGGINYCFAVLNTIDDRMVEYDYFNSLDVGSEAEIDTYMAKWNSLLEEFNISGQIINPTAKADNLSRFPYEGFQSKFDYDIIGNDTVDWNLLVYNIDNPSMLKVVTQQTTHSPVLNRIRILGYHKSPYENRIAIFVSLIFGFSGNVLFDPMGFGCHMGVGFN